MYIQISPRILRRKAKSIFDELSLFIAKKPLKEIYILINQINMLASLPKKKKNVRRTNPKEIPMA